MFYAVQLASDIFKEKIAVPSIWLDKDNTFCLLPPMTDVSEIGTLAEAKSAPKHGWQMHSVSLLQSFDTYPQAKKSITKAKPVMIELEVEKEKQHCREMRGKRKLRRFLKQNSIDSDNNKEKDCSSTLDNTSMEDSVVPDPQIVKIETMEDSNISDSHQQQQLNTTHNESFSSVHSSLQYDCQIQIAANSSPTRGKKVAPLKRNSEIKDLLVSILDKMTADENTECTKCGNLEEILKSKNEEIERLQNEIQNREHALQESKNKYKEMKRKYKEKKKEIKGTQEGKKFGSIFITEEKLSLCRDNNYSIYVGELLEICFGKKILSRSVLKFPNNRTCKTNVLEQDVINDITRYTKEKFSSVTVSMVRTAIRQKLNACHKAQKMK